MTYDNATGNAWTATYAGLTDADITTALTADTSATWTVTDAAGTPREATAHETGANAIAGPTTGCAAPRERVQIAGSETVRRAAPTHVVAAVNVNTVTLDLGPSSDPPSAPAASGVQIYGIFRDSTTPGHGRGRDRAERQTPNSRRRRTTSTQNLRPGTYTYTVRATDAANNDSPRATSNHVTARTTPRPPAACR